MHKPILLDSGVISQITHPKNYPDTKKWFERMLDANITVYISEASDYEARRGFIARDLTNSLNRLEWLNSLCTYLSITTPIMRQAAQMWAQAKKGGYSTADVRELDFDIIIAAHILEVGAIVVTTNVGHLLRYVEAKNWNEIEPADLSM
ncbi:MAG: PIN domain-containing protein [Acidobacteriota bacterium]